MASTDSIEQIMASSDSTEVPPSSLCETPTIIDSTKTKSKSSIRHLLSDFKAKFCVSKPKSLENNYHDAASSSETTNRNDDQAGAISLSSKMIRSDLLLVDSAFAEVKKYMDHVNMKINQAHEKFQELQMLGSSRSDFDKLRKAIVKLKSQIPTKIRSSDFNPHRNRWPNINEAEDGMAHFFYKEPKPVRTCGSNGLWKAYHDLLQELRHFLLCFFKFPPEATIKRPTLIYLWIGHGYTFKRRSSFSLYWERKREEDVGNEILDELIAKGFIEPIYQKCSLEPDSCRMSVSVRSSLYKDAEVNGFTSKNSLDLDLGFVCGGRLDGHSCMVNVGEAIINYETKIFEKNYIHSLHLGRWQSSTTHHIELEDSKILHGLNMVKSLKYLSLQGISFITELPTANLELNELKILDLRACHNLEAIPDDIGLLRSLTHLDMSECYFLEHMPKSLAQLRNLEVLKGFLIGDFSKNKKPCTLCDLSRLKLRKLNIYVSVKASHKLWDFDDLKKFWALKKLSISWGGCRQSQEVASMELLRRGPLPLPPSLQKLDLQGFPIVTLTNWLRPTNIKGLEKLYIRGGQLRDLGQVQKWQGDRWTLKILRLKYLSDLEIDWSELRLLFPELIYLHQVECPSLLNFPCDERGVWMNQVAIDTHG